MHGTTIDFAQGMVTWAGECLATHCRIGHEQACRVKLADELVIPAGMGTLVPGLASRPLATGDQLMEPPGTNLSRLARPLSKAKEDPCPWKS